MAYYTHLLTNKSLQQPFDASVFVSPSRGSTFIKKHVHITTASDKKSSAIKSEHLPPIRHFQVASAFRHHSINDSTARRAVQFLLKYNKSPARPPKKYITKTMSTTTTTKPVPIGSNRVISHSKRSLSSDSKNRVRKFWWAPKRNEIEIRSEYDLGYKKVSAKVNSLANLEYRPHGGQVSIRDEPVQWQASPKVNSFANASWSPSQPAVNHVRKEKLQWSSQAKVDSMSNIDYKPAGGTNIAIRDEKIDLSHVTPRVDCGFVD